jgi:hypothetical protein
LPHCPPEAVKCFLDTNVLDWILEHPRGEDLLRLLELGIVSGVTAADNAYEISRIPLEKADKKERLRALLLGRLTPVALTRVPIAGIARMGAARVATDQVMELRDQLKAFGIAGLDSNHLINAEYEGCEYFLTEDARLRKKAGRAQALLAVRCLSPEEFLDGQGQGEPGPEIT